jgi:transcriptional regulator with XRE-family HTH domain
MAKEVYSRNLIHTARLQAGLTQAELARKGKTSQAAVSAYESGKRSPSVETLSRLIRVTGMELRMRLSEPDTHDASRKSAEKILPRSQVRAHITREGKRISAHGRGPKT